mgnify:FL=1
MSIKNLPADYLLAAQQGDIDKVKTCLALGVDINTCDRQGKTAITLASLYQQYACVQALIDAGADINKQDHTCLNPFLISCLNDDLTLLRIILPAKPDLNCVTRFGGVGLTRIALVGQHNLDTLRIRGDSGHTIHLAFDNVTEPLLNLRMTSGNDDFHVDLPRLKRCYPLYTDQTAASLFGSQHCSRNIVISLKS